MEQLILKPLKNNRGSAWAEGAEQKDSGGKVREERKCQ